MSPHHSSPSDTIVVRGSWTAARRISSCPCELCSQLAASRNKYLTTGMTAVDHPPSRSCCDTNEQLHLYLDPNIYPRPHPRPGLHPPRLFYPQIPLGIKVSTTPRGTPRRRCTPLQANFLRREVYWDHFPSNESEKAGQGARWRFCGVRRVVERFVEGGEQSRASEGG